MRQTKSIRIFQNPLLESLTHVHPLIPLLIFCPLIVFFFLDGWATLTAGKFAFVFLLGLLFWTFVEYALHRWLFHFPAESENAKKIVFLFHGLHHDAPTDASRLVMPPVVSLSLGSLCYGLFSLIITAHFLSSFFAGFLLGYLIYDYIHFATHHFRPKTALGHFLKKQHMHHHFINHDENIGVSSPLWDKVFGTFRQLNTENSNFVQN
jgi:sterol desaturase/sphingolipid hydroxylase (fatty acid hydroxylase superfamily)